MKGLTIFFATITIASFANGKVIKHPTENFIDLGLEEASVFNIFDKIKEMNFTQVLEKVEDLIKGPVPMHLEMSANEKPLQNDMEGPIDLIPIPVPVQPDCRACLLKSLVQCVYLVESGDLPALEGADEIFQVCLNETLVRYALCSLENPASGAQNIDNIINNIGLFFNVNGEDVTVGVSQPAIAVGNTNNAE